MNMNRRGFIGALTASAAANAIAGSDERTDIRPAVPEGRIFEGMGGAYGAMFTPYHPDSGKLNEEMVEKVVEYAVKTGLTGLYLTGSTGESLLLTLDERKRVYARAKKAANGRLKLIAHVGCLTTDDSCELARYAAKVGMDWVSSIAPVYFGQNFEAMFDHYKRISEASDLPFMAYSYKSTLEPDNLAKLFELKNVHGMKYTGREYYELGMLKRRLPKPAIFFAGMDEQVLNALATGEVSGCIGSTEDVIPRHYVKICSLAAQNRFDEARRYQEEACRLVDEAIDSPNFSVPKCVLRYIGLDSGPARRPWGRPLTEAEYEAIIAKVRKVGIVRENDANI